MANFDAFRSDYELIGDGLKHVKPGYGLKVHLELISSMLERYLAGRKDRPKEGTLEWKRMRVELVRMIADSFGVRYRPTPDGNPDPDPDLRIEPSGVIFYRPKRLNGAGLLAR